MDHSRYHGPSPVRTLAPLAGLLLAAGFVIRATGHDPVALTVGLAHWILTGGPA